MTYFKLQDIVNYCQVNANMFEFLRYFGFQK